MEAAVGFDASAGGVELDVDAFTPTDVVDPHAEGAGGCASTTAGTSFFLSVTTAVFVGALATAGLAVPIVATDVLLTGAAFVGVAVLMPFPTFAMLAPLESITFELFLPLPVLVSVWVQVWER